MTSCLSSAKALLLLARVTFFLPTILARVGAAPKTFRASEGDPGVMLTLIMSCVSAYSGCDSCTWLASRWICLKSVVSRFEIDWCRAMLLLVGSVAIVFVLTPLV